MTPLSLLLLLTPPVSAETVYFGTVFPTGEVDPLYVYERRVDDGTSTHITRDLDGHTVLAESAVHDVDYALVEYELHRDQLGRTGSITVDGDAVTFSAGGRSRTETVRDPVVVGPTLVGHVVRNLDRLRSGDALPVRFAVLERLGTVAFGLRARPDGIIEMKVSNRLYRLVLRPVTFTFDDRDLLVRLEGRVPPKVRVADRWRALDARVEYRFVADHYR